MKLLLDENISPSLTNILSDFYPGIAHVRDFGLKSGSDIQVWAHAASNGYSIVTKDADFHHRSLLRGHPPKVIWIRLGNCSTRDIAKLLVARLPEIKVFFQSVESSFLVIA